MSDDIASLMQPGGTNWRDEALCQGDDRFINPAFKHDDGLKAMCSGCPVSGECARWAIGKVGVFAAGFWRAGPCELVEDWHGRARGGA